MIRIAGVLVDDKSSHSPNAATGLESKDLSHMDLRLLELAKLAVGRRQPNVRRPVVRCAGRTLAQRRQRLGVALQNVVGVSQETQKRRRMKGIEALRLRDHLDGSIRLTGIGQNESAMTIAETGI